MVKRARKTNIRKKTKVTKSDSNMVAISSDRTISVENHSKLLNWLFDRITPSLYERDERCYQYDCIIQGLAAKTESDELEKERREAYATGKSNIVSELRYPKVLGNINDIAANIMNVLFPARQMYGSVELTPEKQNVTAVIVERMNFNARKMKHYTNMFRCINDAVALNIAIAENEYIEIKGFTNKLKRNRRNLSQVNSDKTIAKGTKLRHLDVFNTILDYSVDAENYSTDAEFYAKVEKLTDFDLIRMHDRGEITIARDVEEILRKVKMVDGVLKLENEDLPYYNTTPHFKGSRLGGSNGGSGKSTFGGLYYYRNDFRTYNKQLKEDSDLDHAQRARNEGCKPFDLLRSLHHGKMSDYDDKPTAKNELLTITIRAREKDIRLTSRTGTSGDGNDTNNDMKIWRIAVLNGVRIVSVKEVAENHGMLPCSITVPKTELSKHNSLSISELLLPFQEADSSLMNIFLKQARSDKNKGITYFAKDLVDMGDMLDPSTGRIGVSIQDLDKNGRQYSLRDLIHNVQGHPINNSLLDASNLLTQKTQDIFPTQSIDNLANLNRPVTHQSRQLTQLQNLPIYILARTIHDELLEPQNYMHTEDILAYSDNLRVINEKGEEESIDPNTLDLEDLDLAVSDGLRGVDTIAVMDRLNQILQYAFQSPEANREYDVMKIADYLLKMEGANINMEAFKFQNPFDALSPEQKQLALQLLQQAAQQQEESEET
jgi:hypothetical protein